jgi:hypothetical protein
MITAVLALTAVWHALAVWHFTLYPERTIARATSERPVSVVGAELFRFLGGMNAALVVLGAGACFGSMETVGLAAAVLCVANASQLVQDVRIARSGLASGAFFGQIVAGDALFTVANAAVWVATR